MRLRWQVFDWRRIFKLGPPASPALCGLKNLGIASTPAHRRLAVRHHPAILAEQPPATPQHPSTRSHAPPPSVCICIVRTITSAVDTSKSRAGALAPGSSLGVQARKRRAQASAHQAPAKKLGGQSAASRRARFFALNAQWGNSARVALSSACKVQRLACKAQKAARKPKSLAREVPELGVPSKKPCSPSPTLCAQPLLPRPPPSALGRCVAKARAPAALGRAPLGGIHAPPSWSRLSATRPGVPRIASRAPGLVSGGPSSKARAFHAQGAVRGVLAAARRAHRGGGRPNWVARELAEPGVSL